MNPENVSKKILYAADLFAGAGGIREQALGLFFILKNKHFILCFPYFSID